MQNSRLATLRAVFIAGMIVAGLGIASGGAVAGEQYTDFSKPELSTAISGENVVSAGDVRTFTVSVQNRHDGTTDVDGRIDEISRIVQSYRLNLGAASAVSAEVLSPDAPIEVRTASQNVGTIRDGGTRQMPLTVEIGENATPGKYRVPIELSYSYIFGVTTDAGGYTINRKTETVTKYVTVRVEPSVRLTVLDTTTSNLYKNAEGNVIVTIQNSGSEIARNAELVMHESQYISPKPNSVAVGRLAPNETTKATFQASVQGADSAGTYAGDFQLRYDDESGNPKTTERRTGSVSIGGESSFALSAESTGLYVDSTGMASITVTNTGSRPVTDARAVLEPIAPFNLVSSTASLGTLEPGESSTVQFKLEISDQAVAQEYPLTVRVVHDDVFDNAVQSDPSTVGVDVGPESSIGVLNTAQTSAGATETVTYEIENVGNETLSDAVVRINTNSPFETDDDTTYIGTLRPGETTTVTYKISVDGAAPAKTYSLDMSVKYDNALNDTVVTDVQEAPVQVAENDGGLPLSGIAVAGVALSLTLIGALAIRTGVASSFR